MNSPSATHQGRWFSPESHPVAVRCAWKEYRMLRGFWLGVAGLSLLPMLATRWLFTGSEQVDLLFACAWGAAALYAVGAAVTLFAVEREERTDVFLALLPRHDWAMFAGKVLAAAVTAFALAAALVVVGGIVAGTAWPSLASTRSISTTGAVAVVEALAWGVLASLLCPQPLLAAILAIAAASLGVQLAMVPLEQTARGASLDALNAAVPMRLALVAAVALLDIRLGLPWLRPRRSRLSRETSEPEENGATFAKPALRVEWDVTAGAAAMRRPASRRKMFTRLLWQSWREGWQAMLAVLPVGLFLMVADSLLVSLATQYQVGRVPPVLSLLSIPALYGAMVFRADQRGRQYRFLADHAARPSVVWLARQTTWLAPLVAVLIVLQIIAWIAASRFEHRAIADSLKNTWGAYREWLPSAHSAPYAVALEIEHWRQSFLGGSAVAWWATLAAYASAQLCSMLIRSNVLAGFASLLLSVVITVWSILVGVWGLPTTWFVAPLALAALIASLVRCRAWLLEPRGARPYLAPAAVVVVCLGSLAATLGMARVAQVAQDPSIPNLFIREPLDVTLTRWESEEPAAQNVARRYEQLAASFAPTDELLAELTEVSRAPHCHFLSPLPQTSGRQQTGVKYSRPAWETLAKELSADVERQIAAGDLDKALERLITTRRLMAHSMQYQSNAAAPRWDFTRQQELLLKWAEAPGQTSERLLQAVEQLGECESLFPRVNEAIVAEYIEVLAIVHGERPPTILESNRWPAWQKRLAFFMNELPWERRRAEEALARMTELRLDYADAVANGFMPASQKNSLRPTEREDIARALALTNGDRSSSADTSSLAALGNYYWPGLLKQKHETLEAAQSSILPALELQLRSQPQHIVQEFLWRLGWRRGEMMRIALIAYRLDHGSYPDSLADLPAKYAPHGSLADPFTADAFEYRSEGFALPTVIDEWRGLSKAAPAGTPLLWSVGGSYAEPMASWAAETGEEGNSFQWTRAPIAGQPDPSLLGAKPQQVMRFVTTTFDYSTGQIVLTLPPLDAP